MADDATGTVLTCAHGDCGCRVRIEVPCHCTGAGAPYRCTCGDEMVTAG
ncbi:metallothionein [Mycobacterium sp.]